jgi:thioredoxin-like negative regulator of GroEL
VRLLLSRDDAGGARELLARLPEDTEVARLLAEIDLRPEEDLAALRARVEKGDIDAVVSLARSEASAGLHEQALARLLDAVRNGSDEARQAMVDVFLVLGDDHALTRAYRPKLAAALF